MNSGKKQLKSLSFLLLLVTMSSLFAAAVFADGATVYNSNCAGCHRLGTVDTSGSAPDLRGKGTLVDSYFKAGASGHKSITLTATNITELKTFINNPTTTTPLSISTATLAGGTVAVSYSQTLAAIGGKTPYTWSRSSGTLPGGLTISSTGVISGTPTATGTFNFTVMATDSASTKASVTKALSITIAAAAASNGATVYNSNCAGCHKLGTVDTSGSAPNLLGKGSSVDSYYKAGVSGHKGVTLTATNITALKAYINNPTTTPTALTITTTTLPHGTVGTAYSQSLAVTGGLAPYAWSYNGTLPAGIVVTSAGLVTGTPTVAGSYSFTVLVTDSKSTAATQGLTITIASIPMTTADKTLFINNCSNCHTPFGLEKRTAAQIQAAIGGNIGGMGTSALRGLSGASLDGIARSLAPGAKPANDCASCHSSTTPPSSGSPGQALYDLQCAGCHGLGTYDTSGTPNLLGRGSAVAGKFGSAHYGITLSATDISNVTAFINNPSATPQPPTPTPTPVCGSCHTIPPGTGSHSNSNHRRLSCSTCHGSGFSSTTVNTATHNNGVKNVVTTIGWNASTRTCSNSCHGSEKW